MYTDPSIPKGATTLTYDRIHAWYASIRRINLSGFNRQLDSGTLGVGKAPADIQGLTVGEGELVTADEDGVTTLDAGTAGETLRVSSGYPSWGKSTNSMGIAIRWSRPL